MKHEIARLKLGDMGPFGDTLAEFNGEQINVFGGISGEEVICRIIRYRRKRKFYVSAFVEEVLSPSPHRIKPPCPYFGGCTGCQWQHISYTHQLEMKRDTILREFGNYGTLENVKIARVVASPQTFGYRNHARFTVRENGAVGFVNRVTRRFVKVKECLLMNSWINTAIGEVDGRCSDTSQLSIRYGVNTGAKLIQPKLVSNEIGLESGQTHYYEEMLGKNFRIASPSFFQVNTAQAETVVSIVCERLGLTGEETLVDAYAGVGTFAALLAPLVRHVIAIEESKAAVEDAAINVLGLDGVQFLHGKTETILGSLGENVDVVVLDPSRTGCQPEVLEAVAGWFPRKICYVSCDPKSLARDLDHMVKDGLRLDHVEPIDMFPQTHHVECVATLSSVGRN